MMWKKAGPKERFRNPRHRFANHLIAATVLMPYPKHVSFMVQFCGHMFGPGGESFYGKEVSEDWLWIWCRTHGQSVEFGFINENHMLIFEKVFSQPAT